MSCFWMQHNSQHRIPVSNNVVSTAASRICRKSQPLQDCIIRLTSDGWNAMTTALSCLHHLKFFFVLKRNRQISRRIKKHLWLS